MRDLSVGVRFEHAIKTPPIKQRLKQEEEMLDVFIRRANHEHGGTRQARDGGGEGS